MTVEEDKANDTADEDDCGLTGRAAMTLQATCSRSQPEDRLGHRHQRTPSAPEAWLGIGGRWACCIHTNKRHGGSMERKGSNTIAVGL